MLHLPSHHSFSFLRPFLVLINPFQPFFVHSFDMTSCDHSSWLSLTRQDQPTFVQTDRLRTLARELTEPDAQRPDFVVCLGGRPKSAALREMFDIRAPLQHKVTPGDVHLHL